MHNEVSYDFYHLVPKERRANLEYRKEVLERSARDSTFRKNVWIAAKRDTLYFFNTFLWVYEPRPGMDYGQGKVPFITWPGQDRGIRVMDKFWGLKDIKFWKTRGEGATWLAIGRILKDWIFEPRWNPAAFGLVTRNEETCDSPDDPDSLMWKMDWELQQLPQWMVPDFNRKISEHSLKNNETGSTIVGYAASEDVGSGGRKRVYMMDELAKFGYMRKGADHAAMSSTQPVTECRLIISTPKGTGNAYFDSIAEDVDVDKYQVTRRLFTEEDHEHFSSVGVIVFHWTDNPVRNRGLFRVTERTIVPVDEQKFGPIPQEYKDAWPSIREKLERRGYTVLGTIRSPWYDAQCLRSNATPQTMAQEYDLDFGGSGFTLFDGNVIAIARRSCCKPMFVGEVDYNELTLEPTWCHHPSGRMKVWCAIDPTSQRPSRMDRYVIGVDIASGLGGSAHSNSVASVMNLDTGEQVGEWANNAIPPYEFCDQVIAIAKWFHNAKIIHEANGPFGKAFTGQLIRREYGNIFRRKERFKVSQRTTKELGWGSNQETKADLMAGLANKIRMGVIQVRSKDAVDELKSWVMQDGRIVHDKARSTEDESSKNEAHGDRVIALGCATLLYDPSLEPTRLGGDPAPGEIPDQPIRPNCMAYRLLEYDKRQADARDSLVFW